MQEALVDIFVPTFEPNPAYLHEAMDSVLAQTERRFSVLINDDASQTDVATIVAPYLHDPRFTFRRSTIRRGIGGNCNACLRFGSAPYVQYLFQDDLWYPQHLERALRAMREYPDIPLVSVEHRYACEKGIPTARGYGILQRMKRARLREGRYDGPTFLRDWVREGLESNLIGEPSFVLIHREALERVGGFCESMRQLLDVDVWVRILIADDWYFVPEELGMFRVHREGASYREYQEGASLFERFRCMERLGAQLPPEHPLHNELIHCLDEHLTAAIKHIVNRRLQGRRIGKGARPTIAYLRTHPSTALRSILRYSRQASGRWIRKGLARAGLPAFQAPQYLADQRGQ